jgi:hypothetical protein
VASYQWLIKSRHEAIKKYYLNTGHTEQEWLVVNNNPKLFNNAWRKMLGLLVDGTPPPARYRTLQ